MVSVIVPCYNSGFGYLREAVEGILIQAVEGIEVIVVDDGSSDDSIQRAEDYFKDRITIIRQSNQGPSAARNIGILAAKHSIISFNDADDTWPKNRLLTHLKVLKERQCDVVIGHNQPFVPKEMTTSDLFERPIEKSVSFGAATFTKEIFSTVGLLDETLLYSEDHDWFLRAREKNASIVRILDISLYHRVHSKSMTYGKEYGDFGMLKILKKSIERRKNESSDVPTNLKTNIDK